MTREHRALEVSLGVCLALAGAIMGLFLDVVAGALVSVAGVVGIFFCARP